MRRVLPIALLLTVFTIGSIAPPAAAGPEARTPAPTADAAAKKKSKKKKCKKGYVRKKVKVGKGKKRRTVVRCVKKKRKPSTTQPGTTTQPQPAPQPGTTTQPQPAPQPGTTTQPQEDPQAKYADLISRMQLLRTYQVPKPGGGGYNTHSEQYGWCNPGSGRRMIHYYEGIAYIYKSNGPYTILSGSASADGSTGDGLIRYTQEQANFQEEVGKVQEIRISWTGDVATVVHPEIGTNNFAKSVRSNENC